MRGILWTALVLQAFGASMLTWHAVYNYRPSATIPAVLLAFAAGVTARTLDSDQ